MKSLHSRDMFTVEISASMDEHLSGIESLLIQIEYEFLEIKQHLNSVSSQEHLLRHLYERRQAVLNMVARRQAVASTSTDEGELAEDEIDWPWQNTINRARTHAIAQSDHGKICDNISLY